MTPIIIPEDSGADDTPERLPRFERRETLEAPAFSAAITEAEAARALELEARRERREASLASRLRWVGPVVALVLASVALWVLHHQLHAYSYRQIVRNVRDLPRPRLLLALLITAIDYSVLPLYDALSLHYAGRKLPARRLYLSSFVAYAFSHNIGMSALTGTSIRYRFWSGWGLSASEIAQAVAFTTITFWLGVLTVGGVTLLYEPAARVALSDTLAAGLGALGVVLLLVVAGYLAWSLSWRRPLAIRGWRFRAPTPALALGQLVVASADWTLAAMVLYALLPHPQGFTFLVFLAVYLLAQIVGLVSHVPGGLGVFESLMVMLLQPWLSATPVVGALLAYRAIYYLLPLGGAMGALTSYEIGQRSEGFARAARAATRWIPSVVPNALSLTTFLAGAILLVSSATPSVHSRVRFLDAFLPLGVIELSHFIASLAGVGLLLLARGLARRLDAAYQMTLVLLAVGIVASLLKGLDYEEAFALAVVLLAVAPSHRHFYRRAALTTEPFTPGWIVAVTLVVVGTLWIGFFSFKHVSYSNALWLRFTTLGDAPRFLRAAMGSVGAVVLVAFSRLMRPAPVDPALPADEDLARVEAILERSGSADANLALLGDKAILFDDKRESFLAYGVAGRSWVALGDPVGPPRQRVELAWQFRELADRHGGWPVFYQVTRDALPLYIDLGLTLTRLGEEARVPLDEFSLEGGQRKSLRRAHKAAVTAGCTFELVPRERTAALLDDLRVVSDAWLEAKHTREKGFSLGRFDPAYLCRFPIALVRHEGRIVAFANVMTAGAQQELSVDLMRFLPAAPDGSMDFLFVELMLWGRAQGYHWFNLGMAPFSGFEARALAPRWHRLGALVYRHGEHFYNFRGLRQYKEKFHPEWEPKYLASPGGFALPRILANVATLVSGGLKGVVSK